MNILLLSDSYPPEVRSSAILMKELADGLVKLGHCVSVCTLLPKYNLVCKLDKNNQFLSSNIENGVRVIRLNSLPIHNTSMWVRGIGELTLPAIFSAGSLIAKKPDIIAIYSPPLPLGLAAAFMKILRGTPFLLNVQDLFPQNIIDVGKMRNPAIVGFFKGMERLIYSLAQKITVHSESNRDFLLKERGVCSSKVEIIHNWVDTDLPLKYSLMDFRRKWGIKDKFILFFGGVMGHTQGLEMVLEVAESLKNVKDIIFLLVGDGSARANLEQIVEQRNLSNVLFKPFISPQEYWSLLNEIDVGLLTLSAKVKTPVVPSKFLGYMAASKPYIASLNKESDAIRMTQDSKAGIYVRAGDAMRFKDAILTLFNNKNLVKVMGRNGRKYVVNNFSKDICIAKYENILKQCGNIIS